MIAKLLFILAARAHRSRISPFAYLKGLDCIRIGHGSKVHSQATIDAGRSPGVVIGNGVTLNRYACIQGADGGVAIGDGSEVNNFSVVNGAGRVDIGRDVLIGPGAKIISYQHSFDDAALPIRGQPYRRAPIVIEDGAWIGAGAVVLAGVVIGRGAVVGAGAVVTRSCPPGAILVGVPARIARMRPGFEAQP